MKGGPDASAIFLCTGQNLEFTSKPIRAWASLAAIMGKFLEQLYFRHWVENAQPVQETSNNSCGASSKVLSHRLTVFTGSERLGHRQWWQHGVQVFTGVPGAVNTSARISRFTTSNGPIKPGPTPHRNTRTAPEITNLKQSTPPIGSSRCRWYMMHEEKKTKESGPNRSVLCIPFCSTIWMS
ncbi:MAG: hypothetical protein BWX80_02154 [Candidatus Hydrogenedentes bacterium ADurb.Bin101]|jgi:hypothetical protein|nr:MAG: hypothetical protein BWX80_02154 [Candidatus Hydrogenedentes bacterium ADurb.Bin101]HOC68794.1 hypothetical protein [Candidatus Hydrogenedentota bacterium]